MLSIATVYIIISINNELRMMLVLDIISTDFFYTFLRRNNNIKESIKAVKHNAQWGNKKKCHVASKTAGMYIWVGTYYGCAEICKVMSYLTNFFHFHANRSTTELTDRFCDCSVIFCREWLDNVKEC